uniref:Uncharacterized protein n=1 Tax=Strongyloides venezuelensis TaxID=75913 RepID=A0A0K0G603_STRVS
MFLVPEEQNSNYFRKKHYRSQKRSISEDQKDVCREDKFILRAPVMLVEKAAKKKEGTFKLIKLFGA